MAEYPESRYLVEVRVSKVWPNCPRYVHQYKRVTTSRYVPGACAVTPMPAWKRIDAVQDAIPAKERAQANAEGLIDFATYEAMVRQGDA